MVRRIIERGWSGARDEEVVIELQSLVSPGSEGDGCVRGNVREDIG